MAARRSGSSEETAFLRGDVGVDGQATEEQRDIAELERDKAREQFLRGKAYLGREFLTWLLWRSESGEPVVVAEGAPVVVALTSRLVLRGLSGEVLECIVRGATAPYSHLVRRSLARGLLVHQARLRLMHGEEPYEVTLDAEFMDLKSAKLPETAKQEPDDALHERLHLAERLGLLVQAMLETFLSLRSGRDWPAEVAELRAWMEAPEPPRKPAAKKATRRG